MDPITKRSPMELDNNKVILNLAARRLSPNGSHGGFVGRPGNKAFLIIFPNSINCYFLALGIKTAKIV